MVAKLMERAAQALRRDGIAGDRWIVHPAVLDTLRDGAEIDAPRIVEIGEERFFMGIPVEIGLPAGEAPFEFVKASGPADSTGPGLA